MKCPRCQQEISSDASFCPKCGTPLDNAVSPAASYADRHAEIQGLRRGLGEALEQETATAEILRVIRSSPTDVQPVLDTIVTLRPDLAGGTGDGTMRRRELIAFVTAAWFAWPRCARAQPQAKSARLGPGSRH